MVDAKGEISIFKDSLSEANSLIAQASNTTADSLAATRANLSTSAQAARGVDQLAKTAGALAEQLTTLSQTMDARGRSQVKAMSDLTAETTKAAAQWRGEIEELNGAIVDGAQKIAKALRDAGR
jgi:methyl-accepting chemotaxis protein